MLAMAHALADTFYQAPSTNLDPGDAGWGDVLFVCIWAAASLLLASYYCYRAFFTTR